MHVLITGITGYISRYLLKFAPPDIKISGTFHSPLNSEEKSAFKHINLVQLELQNPVEVQLQNIKADVVIHTAAVSGLAESASGIEQADRINNVSSGELARWAKNRSCKFIYLSTDIVFDGLHAPYSESDKCVPVNSYGKSKYDGELAVLKNNDNAIITRLALVLGQGIGRKKNFIDWLHNSVRLNQEIPLFTDEIRTPVCAIDVAKTIWHLTQKDAAGIFHLCGNKSIDRYELGCRICNYIDANYNNFKKASLHDMPYRRPVDVSLKDNRLLEILNYSIPSPLDEIGSLFNESK
ncbi:MAG: SDR family oxidoreductase [Calditrichae bacterium]|nr:SDR family oxidoreductase [Calditrichota bacterium]MCB9058904.1 SDR family oxidoreductase [Calditrichia bacterium]